VVQNYFLYLICDFNFYFLFFFMATNLTSIFGSEIRVANQPVRSERTYHAWPGSHGLTSMFMGSRGAPFIVTGRLRATGASYSAARALLQTGIDAIEAWQFAYPQDYTFAGTTWPQTVFDRFELIRDGSGKSFHMDAVAGYVYCDFIAVFICLY
jgi:hypothetical protein